MNPRTIFGAGLCATALLAPLAARAQNGTENYYTPPKLLKAGRNTTATSGAATVVVQVFVKTDGTFHVQRVLRSTNHADDAAATEIASTSTYRPATRGGKPVSAFYDFTLKFTASGTSSSETGGAGGSQAQGASTAAGTLAVYERQTRNGNYTGAQAGLKTYVAQHPDDQKAQLDLGIASAYLNDADGATAAFDRAGTIPQEYRAVAAKAYADAAAQDLKNKELTKAVAAAKRATELSPGVFTYNALGTSEDAAGDGASAVADLEKARALAAHDASIKPADRARIDANLVAAYLDSGKPEMARQISTEATQVDPNQTATQMMFAGYYAKQAQDAMKAGKFSDAAALYEQAAGAAPSQAVSLYARAAFSYLQATPKPDNDKAKSDADKALALSPDDAAANYAAGVSLANQGKSKDALVFLNKADASAKTSGDPSLTAQIESAIKQVTASK